MARVLSAIIFLPILFAAFWMGAPIWFSAIAAAGILIGLYDITGWPRTAERFRGWRRRRRRSPLFILDGMS